MWAVVCCEQYNIPLLSPQFERRETSKTYIALAAGHPAEDDGEINLPMRKDMVNKPRHIIDLELGKHSVTRWRVRERMSGSGSRYYTVVALFPSIENPLRCQRHATSHHVSQPTLQRTLSDSPACPTSSPLQTPSVGHHVCFCSADLICVFSLLPLLRAHALVQTRLALLADYLNVGFPNIVVLSAPYHHLPLRLPPAQRVARHFP